MTDTAIEQPPLNTKHISKWSELPDCKDPAMYSIIVNGERRTFLVSKKKRQVLEGLIHHPLACASKCRLSDCVLHLRRDYGLDIEMKMYQSADESDGESYGVYFLKSEVERVEEALLE
jgi:hypothetical protein